MSERILTANWHEAYLHLMAKTGYPFDVILKEKGGVHGWLQQVRPVPDNVRLIDEEEARSGLASGRYAAVVGHNLTDLVFAFPFESVPKIVVFHNKLTTEILLGRQPVDRAAYMKQVTEVMERAGNVVAVFISEAKQRDWGLGGEIILPGIDMDEYGGYEGTDPRVLRVGNLLMERDVMLGYSLQERIVGGLESTVLGLNPRLPQAVLPPDWDDFRRRLREHRVYLNTTLHPYEDGYNLAMLEAMATGMPVVSAANPSSPLTDGWDGYVSEDETRLRERILELLRNRDLCRTLGRRARETVNDRFPLQRFLARWRETIEGVRAAAGSARAGLPAVQASPAGAGGKGRAVDAAAPESQAPPPEPITAREQGAPAVWQVPDPSPRGRRLRILMSYTANPQTTASYLEKALRAQHDVVTHGPCIDEGVLKAWDLEAIRGRIRPHDIPFEGPDLGRVTARLPAGWRPDLFLWVETGIHYPLQGLETLGCPTACYLVDTHLNLEWHLEIARHFDHVFIAQHAYLSRFREAGLRHVSWLPLGCDPDVHGKRDVDKRYGLSFVGSITAANGERNRLLLRLAERFPLHVERCFLEEMAQVFSASRIVFNRSVKDDLNMRVFEALAAGSLLVTDEAPGSRLTDLFRDGKHLAVYRTEAELFERVKYYLEHEQERERIAARGRREVLDAHTYACRARRMLAEIGLQGAGSQPGQGTTLAAGQAEAVPGLRDRSGDGGSSAGPTPVVSEGGDAELPAYYRKEREEVAALVAGTALRILDVGCGGGSLGRRLKADVPSREVWGVEVVAEAAREAGKWLDHVATADASGWVPPVDEGYFDTILFADVLEHLAEPAVVLRRYLRWLAPHGQLVLSIPNVRYWGVVRHLADGGNWTYQDEGILDRGHLRFFTRSEIVRLLEGCGMEVHRLSANTDPRCPEFPEEQRTDLELGRLVIRDLSAAEAREFFHVQYLVVAVRKRAWLRAHARRSAAAGNRSTAFRLYAHLHDRYPEDPAFLAAMTETAPGTEARRRTIEYLERYLDLRPAHVDSLLATARLLAEEERYEEARARLERILLFAPDHAEARTRLQAFHLPDETAPGLLKSHPSQCR